MPVFSISGHMQSWSPLMNLATFPLTDEDKQHALELKAALISEHNNLHINLFHTFIKPLVYPNNDSHFWDPTANLMNPLNAFMHFCPFMMMVISSWQSW
jgi:hypothetical protein